MNQKTLSNNELKVAAAVIRDFMEEAANAESKLPDSDFSFPVIRRTFFKLEDRADKLLESVESELESRGEDIKGLPEGEDAKMERACRAILETNLDESRTGYDGDYGNNVPSVWLLTKWLR